MEIIDYFRVIKSRSRLVIGCAFVFAAVVWINLARHPYNYSGSVTFTVGNQSLQPADNFNYDRYYNLSASVVLAETLSNWLGSPNVVEQIYQAADVELPTRKTIALTRTIRSIKPSPNSNVVVAIFSGKSKDEVEKTARSTIEVINSQLGNLKKSNSFPSEMTISASQPIALEEKKNALQTVGIGALSGLIFGVVLTVILSGLKPSERNL